MESDLKKPFEALFLTRREREEAWRYVSTAVEHYLESVAELPVAPSSDRLTLRKQIERFDFLRPVDPKAAIDFAVQGLTRDNLHTAHPRYHGVFNPAPSTMGIVADTLVASFNPQLASWVSAPFAIEVEEHLVREFAKRFGFPEAERDGVFTSGGAEANHTSLLSALNFRFPELKEKGLVEMGFRPSLYVSAEGHHSFLKAARMSGLGSRSVREIPTDSAFCMDSRRLDAQIQKDMAEGFTPFMVVATAGTTNAGMFDPIREIAEIAKRHGLWFHVDAAWGGAAIVVPELAAMFSGVEQADSLTLDAHKWLSVPMGAGLFLTRHRGILESTFHLESTPYMYRPSSEANLSQEENLSPKVQPYMRSMQWSRRFTGLKLFLTLAVAGWEGYAQTLRHQISMGKSLRQRLTASGWKIWNSSALPVICFSDDRFSGSPEIEAIAKQIGESGKSWVTTTRLGGRPVLRAGISSYRTEESDIAALVELLDQVRTHILSKKTDL